MACVPDPASLVPPDVIVIRPVVSLTFSTIVPGLLAAKASATETPATEAVVPAVTRVAGRHGDDGTGRRRCCGVRGRRVDGDSDDFGASMPAWSQTSMPIELVPALLPAV